MKKDTLEIVLRGVAKAMSGQIAPELNSALAKDAATFGAGLLRGLLLEAQSAPRIADYEQALSNTLSPVLVEDQISRERIGAWIEGLYLQAGSSSDVVQVLAAVASEEKRLQAAIRADDLAEDQRALEAGDATGEAVNGSDVAAYLNQKLKRSDVEVVDIRLIPGGGSKITRLILLKPLADLPEELIMRQDYAVNHVGNSVANEYAFLSALQGADIPIAAPLLLESAFSALGAPFMLVEKIVGEGIGNLWGFFPGTTPKPVCLELARVLAKIHSLPLDRFELADGDAEMPLRERVQQQIRDIYDKWTVGRSNTSPVIAMSLLWLAENLDTQAATPALVHGDCAFTNILVHQDHIAGLLDWEFAHIGDPAEDLAYIKDVVEQVMPWQEFVDAYCAEGGKVPSAERLRYFDIWRALRNAIYAGIAGEGFLTGANTNLMLGWAGIYAVPLLEFQLMEMIGDTWQLQEKS